MIACYLYTNKISKIQYSEVQISGALEYARVCVCVCGV